VPAEASSGAHREPVIPARHPGKRLGVYPGSPKVPASAYETIPHNALRHFRHDADAGRDFLRPALVSRLKIAYIICRNPREGNPA
jgi:hypothetical protein